MPPSQPTRKEAKMDNEALRIAISKEMSGFSRDFKARRIDNIIKVFERFAAAKDAEIRNLKSLNSALESDNANNSMNLEHLSSQLSEKEAHFIEHSKSEAQIIEDLRYCNVALKAEIKRLRQGIASIEMNHMVPMWLSDQATELLSPADGDANRLEDMLEETAPDGYEIVTFTKKKSNEH